MIFPSLKQKSHITFQIQWMVNLRHELRLQYTLSLPGTFVFIILAFMLIKFSSTAQNPERILKLKKLKKLVTKSLQESGVAEPENQLHRMLMDKVC